MEGHESDDTQMGEQPPGAASASVDSKPQAVAELHHVAGLTAGRTFRLRPGTIPFGPRRWNEAGLAAGAPDIESFQLTIDTEGNATLTPGHEPVAVGGQVVTDGPVPLEDGDIIQLLTDQFTLRSLNPTMRRSRTAAITPRSVTAPTLPSMRGWLGLFALVALAGILLGLIRSSLFGIALIGIAGVIITLLIRSRRREQAEHEHATQLANAGSLLFNEILEARKETAEEMRSDANTPIAIARRHPSRTTVEISPLLATIASGDQPWEPPVVCHRDPGWDHQDVVDRLNFLPAIPVSIDLDQGPVAVVGPRAATLAVARHLAATALTSSPATAGVTVTTKVPADWRWLAPRSTPDTLSILDGVDGPIGPRTVVLAASLEDLPAGITFDHVMHIGDDGRASISVPSGEAGTGFTPHGITEAHAIDIHRMAARANSVIDLRHSNQLPSSELATIDLTQADNATLDLTNPGAVLAMPAPVNLALGTIDLVGAEPATPVVGGHVRSDTTRPQLTSAAIAHTKLTDASLTPLDTRRLLVTGPDRSRNKSVLATAALRQAAQHPDRSIFILDRGDRALIRLAQLDACRRYAAIDHVENVEAMVQELEGLEDEPAVRPVLMLAPDLWEATAFYRNSGRADLADRIDQIVSRMEIVPMAASAPGLEKIPDSSFLVWVNTAESGPAELHFIDPAGPEFTDSQPLDVDSLPGMDLTASVARFTAALTNTPTIGLMDAESILEETSDD